MTTADTPARAGAPWHFWLVTAISVCWNAFGAYDYTMSHLQGDAYYKAGGMSDTQIAFMHSYPVWMHAVWAFGVWGSVVGSVLLLLRSRWAFHAFVVSALGAAGALIYTFVNNGPAAGFGPVMPLVIVAVCVFLVWFSQTMTSRGVLR
jgi:hypothetical protein